MAESVNNHGTFVWSIAELLRGDYKQSEHREGLITAAVTGEIDVDTFDNERRLERAAP